MAAETILNPNRLGTIFPEHVIEHSGKKYVFTPPTFKTEKAYATYLEKRAIEGVMRHQKAWGDAFKEVRLDVTRDIATNQYGWLSPGFQDSLRSDECFKELCYYVLLQKPENEISREENEALYQEHGREIVDTIIGFINRPNSSRLPAEPTKAPVPAGA